MTPPDRSARSGICLLRLSAIGDVSHALAVAQAIRRHRPDVPLTWLVGRVEAPLVRLLPNVEVVPVNKQRLGPEVLRLRRHFAGRRFDALLHLQVALRASMLSLGVPAARRIGFDRARAREGQRWFVNEQVSPAPAPGEHVVEGMMRFAHHLGLPAAPPRWDLVLPAAEVAWADQQLPAGRRVLAINACASHASKDWRVERYAEVARHAVERHDLHVVLIGGPREREREVAADVVARAGVPVQNLVGRTTLVQVMALLRRCLGLLSPDSGPVHLANVVGTPSVGLYAVTNLARSGPYRDRRWCIDKRDAAARRFRGRPAAELAWHEALRDPGVMDLIEVPEVCAKLDELVAARG